MALPSKFEVGQCAATHGAMHALDATGEHAIVFIARHQSGDWGDVSDNDKAANEAALIPDKEGDFDRIMSVYHLKDGKKIYVITDADREHTTVFLPEEY